ncbi:MAG: efflux RND transporter permease subunit, partial [Ignavibacteriae bacterium]
KKPSPLAPFYRIFNKIFGRATNGYLGITGVLVRRSILSLVAVGAFGLLTVLSVGKLPTGFVPAEDQGIIMMNVALPNAASQVRTDEVVRQVEKILADQEGVDQFNAVIGISFLSNAYTSNVASFFVRLKPWDERGELTDEVISKQINQKVSQIPEAVIFAFSIPPIPGFGNASGVKF